MFDTDAIHKRGQALEDEFFRRVDAKLSEQLRDELKREQARQMLADATGFDDTELLDHLIDADLQATKVAALALVPLVFVAWADGTVTTAERQAVISEALHQGLMKQPLALNLIEEWLTHRPPKTLWDLWQEYAEAVKSSLEPQKARSLAEQILGQATAVANASRKTFDLKKISEAEQSVLDEIANLLSAQ